MAVPQKCGNSLRLEKAKQSIHIFLGREIKENYRLVSLTSVPGRIMEQNLLEIMLRNMEGKEKTEVITASLKTKLMVAGDGVAVVVDQGEVSDVSYCTCVE